MLPCSICYHYELLDKPEKLSEKILEKLQREKFFICLTFNVKTL